VTAPEISNFNKTRRRTQMSPNLPARNLREYFPSTCRAYVSDTNRPPPYLLWRNSGYALARIRFDVVFTCNNRLRGPHRLQPVDGQAVPVAGRRQVHRGPEFSRQEQSGVQRFQHPSSGMQTRVPGEYTVHVRKIASAIGLSGYGHFKTVVFSLRTRQIRRTRVRVPFRRVFRNNLNHFFAVRRYFRSTHANR